VNEISRFDNTLKETREGNDSVRYERKIVPEAKVTFELIIIIIRRQRVKIIIRI
jgi:hypothetical protein